MGVLLFLSIRLYRFIQNDFRIFVFEFQIEF